MNSTLRLILIGLVGPFLAIESALALPEGGEIQAGQAQLDRVNPDRLNIVQQSDRAVINWQDFSVGVDQHVDFQQPAATSATLNRVTGEQRSDIAGRITANGQVMLVNPNGILFRPSAQVDVAGLMATTLDIPNPDFMSGRLNLQAVLSKTPATVENQGQITVKEGGFAALVAPGVSNSGVINARLGKVILASGTAATLDFFGDGLVSLAVDPSLAQEIRGADGQPLNALVNQSGQINADGGIVTLSARAGGAVVDRAINMTGVIQARSVSNQKGTVILSGGDAGIVRVSGVLDASGSGAGQTGGTVHVLGDKVSLADRAQIDVSGDTGGGTVLVGGDYKGKGTVPNASRTYVSRDSTTKAGALTSGNGGKVIVWADKVTGFYGNISARGGKSSGNGGFVEVSGKENLIFRGTVDLSANNGNLGTLLLDPRNIIVSSSGENDAQITKDNQILGSDPGETFTISQAALEEDLSGDVRLEATNNITIEDLPESQNDNGTLNLFQNQAGSIAFIADADGDRIGSFSMNPKDTIKTNGGDLTISGASITAGAIDTSSTASKGGDVNLSTTAGNIEVQYINTSSNNQPEDPNQPLLSIELSKAGDVTIDAFGFFQATGFVPAGISTRAINPNGEVLPHSGASIAATGFTDDSLSPDEARQEENFRGGKITITHGEQSFVTGVTKVTSTEGDINLDIFLDPSFRFPENASGTAGAIVSRNTNNFGRVIFPTTGFVSDGPGNRIPPPRAIDRGTGTGTATGTGIGTATGTGIGTATGTGIGTATGTGIGTATATATVQAQAAVETATRSGSSNQSCNPSDLDNAVVEVSSRQAPEESKEPLTVPAIEASANPCNPSNP